MVISAMADFQFIAFFFPKFEFGGLIMIFEIRRTLCGEGQGRNKRNEGVGQR